MTENVFKAPLLPQGAKRTASQPQYGLIAREPESDQAKPEETDSNEVAPAIAPTPEVDRAFDPPFWSKLPPHSYGFEVIKEGVILEAIDLSSRDHWILGRLPPPIVDISVDNPTVSRQHAVILFRDTGEAYLYDLGSVHGSFVNKSQIKAKTYVELRSGDQIRFGQSSRIYVFVGGPAPDEGKAPSTKSSSVEKKQKALALARERREAAAIDSIRKAKQIDENNEDEDEAIRKEYEATEDSETAAEERANEIREFYRNYYGDEQEDEDDAFLDRTENGRRRTQSSQPESFESLFAKCEFMESLREQLLRELEELPTETEAQADGEDDLDRFMAGLAGSFTQERKRKKEELMNEIDREISRLRSLADVIRPATSASALKLTPIQQRGLKEFEHYWRLRKSDAGDRGALPPKVRSDLPDPALKRKRIEDADQPSSQSSGHISEPPPKRQKLEGPGPIEPTDTRKTSNFLIPKTAAPRSLQPPVPTVASGPSEIEEDSWTPPPSQTGDGRTDLNAKLGY